MNKLKLWLFLSLFFAGLIVVIIPDYHRPRLFEISPGHGPSWIDVLGLLVVFGSWLAIVLHLWKARIYILTTLGIKWFCVVIFIYGLGNGMAFSLIQLDFPITWRAGTIMSFVSFMILAIIGFRR